MKSIILGISLLTFSLPALTCTSDGKIGFLPKNNLRIPVSINTVGGLSSTDFHTLLDKVEKTFDPVFSEDKKKLKINRYWDSPFVNASAQLTSNESVISMYGGLARHSKMTKDGYALIICHEIGHHIGGAPKFESRDNFDWGSTEGQADYYATLKCLRRLFIDEDNNFIVKNLNPGPEVKRKCSRVWKKKNDRNICIRSVMAGLSVTNVMSSLSGPLSVAPKVNTPDTFAVNRTIEDYPELQCRLDTYVQGSLCKVDYQTNLSSSDENEGTCHENSGHKRGQRPLCWYNPNS